MNLKNQIKYWIDGKKHGELIRYYQSSFSANKMLSENIALLKKHRMHPTEIGMKDTLRIVEEMKNQ